MNSNMMKILGAVALFAGAVNSHMIMAQPAPFGKPDNSPLSASGSDFPCKLGQVNNFQGTTIQMPSGQSQPLTFTGSAVHGGGSCQISLTKDAAPTKSSSWKVIHSFLGACPGVNGPTAFQFSMPSEVPNGKFTLAWTWFNNIGNREMYMNCAPVEVTGSSGSDSSFTGLPDMAVYNLADINQCKTVETFDVQFPNPGKYVTTAGSFKPKAPTGSNCGGTSNAASGSGSSGASSSSGSSPTAASGSSGSFGEGASGGSGTSSANNGQYTAVGAGSGNSGAGSAGSGAAGSAGSGAAGSSPTATSLLTVYTTQTGSGSAATAGAGSGTSGAGNSTSSTGSTGTGSSSSSSSSGSSSGSSAGSSTAGGSCSPDGSVVCSTDGTQFGLCNFGSAVMMPVASGTKCSNGQIMRRADFKS